MTGLVEGAVNPRLSGAYFVSRGNQWKMGWPFGYIIIPESHLAATIWVATTPDDPGRAYTSNG